MKLTMEFNMPDEMGEADMAYKADHAWRAINTALEIIRSHIKYGNGGAEETLQDVQRELSEARGRLE